MNERDILQELIKMANRINPGVAMDLARETSDPDERKFFAFLADMHLQRAQKQVLEKEALKARLTAIPEEDPDAWDLAMIEASKSENAQTSDGLCEDVAMYEALLRAITNGHLDIHAIYEPDEHGWYCAAADLFQRGLTFRIYFELTSDGEIEIKHLERWWMG